MAGRICFPPSVVSKGCAALLEREVGAVIKSRGISINELNILPPVVWRGCARLSRVHYLQICTLLVVLTLVPIVK